MVAQRATIREAPSNSPPPTIKFAKRRLTSIHSAGGRDASALIGCRRNVGWMGVEGLVLLASMPSVPALLLGRRDDVLAWNPLGHKLVAGHLAFTDPDDPATRPNQMRLLFLDPHTRELHRAWADEAASAVASPRYVAGKYPDDRALAELVGELSLNSREFARLWAKHDVRLCSSGTKRLHHPQVGDLDLHYEVLHLPDSNGQRLLTHAAAVGSAAADALALLG